MVEEMEERETRSVREETQLSVVVGEGRENEEHGDGAIAHVPARPY